MRRGRRCDGRSLRPSGAEVRDYQRKGAVGRLDRLAAARTRTFAIVHASTFTFLLGSAMALSTRRVDTWWAWGGTAAVLSLGAVGLYVAMHRNCRATAEAVREYESRRGSSERSGG